MNKNEQSKQANRNDFRKKHIAKLAEDLRLDPKKEERQLDCNCLLCFYSAEVGGRAITKAHCKGCSVEMTFPSTITNKFCNSCAINNKCCTKCGGDLD